MSKFLCIRCGPCIKFPVYIFQNSLLLDGHFNITQKVSTCNYRELFFFFQSGSITSKEKQLLSKFTVCKIHNYAPQLYTIFQNLLNDVNHCSLHSHSLGYWPQIKSSKTFVQSNQAPEQANIYLVNAVQPEWYKSQTWHIEFGASSWQTRCLSTKQADILPGGLSRLGTQSQLSVKKKKKDWFE